MDPGFALGESAITRNDSQHLTINCFMCHAGMVNGQVVAGMANNHINQSDPRNVRTRGDNFGPYAVWHMGARLDDPANKGLTLASKKTDLEKIFEATPLPPVDPMPWWLMKYKKKDYWYADAAPTDAGSFSINFTTPHAEMNEHHLDHVQSVAKALTFARETQSPPFPGKLDASLVQRGADLFHGRTKPLDTAGFRACKTCHGSYAQKDTAGDLSEPGSWAVDYDFSHVLRNVKTDPAYNTTLQQFKPIADHINKLETYFVAQGVSPESIPHASVPDGEGYVAPPLVGVWASAPYFHNGSVPTIEAVLNSACALKSGPAITKTHLPTTWNTSAWRTNRYRVPSSTKAPRVPRASRLPRKPRSITEPTTTQPPSATATRAIRSAITFRPKNAVRSWSSSRACLGPTCKLAIGS